MIEHEDVSSSTNARWIGPVYMVQQKFGEQTYPNFGGNDFGAFFIFQAWGIRQSQNLIMHQNLCVVAVVHKDFAAPF